MIYTSWSQRKAYVFVTALSLSVGWGIRGNFGHEYGAMIPGALAAMAAVLLSGRSDWLVAVPFFAMFGALGWSFGGSISYMQVIGYTHSGHSPSVLYGFANLFVIGFLWAALGGAGTALPAVADRRRLAELFPPLGFVLVFWWLQGVLIEPCAAGARLRPELVRHGLAGRAPGPGRRGAPVLSPASDRSGNLAGSASRRGLVAGFRACLCWDWDCG